MTGPPPTPRQRIEAECRRRGPAAVAAGCVRLLTGDYADTSLIVVLGGPTARHVLEHGPPYWYRVWGARGLLWNWNDTALEAVKLALHDESWRVREMAAKIVARHLLGDLLPAIAPLRQDPTPRVRTAATRALTRLTTTGA